MNQHDPTADGGNQLTDIPTEMCVAEVVEESVDGVAGAEPRLSHKNFTCLSNASNLLGQSAKSSSAS